MHAQRMSGIAPETKIWPVRNAALLTHLQVVLPILILGIQDQLALSDGGLRLLIDL